MIGESALERLLGGMDHSGPKQGHKNLNLPLYYNAFPSKTLHNMLDH